MIDDRKTTIIYMKEIARCCHTCNRCCGKVTTVVEIVVKKCLSIRFNSALMWCAHIRLAGHCGNTVKNHGAEIVSCNKKASNIKGMKTI